MALDESVRTGKAFLTNNYSRNDAVQLTGFFRCFAAVLLSSSPTVQAQSQTTLRGGGATFPYPIYAKWFGQFHKLRPDVEIEYEPDGQKLTEELLYVPLPKEVLAKEQSAFSKIH